MQRKMVISLLLVLAWLVPLRAQTATAPVAELRVESGIEHPQWADLGMCDVLAVSGSTSLVAPTSVRVLPGNPSAYNDMAVQRHLPSRSRPTACLPHGSPLTSLHHSLYIYILRRLRL